MLYIIFVLFNFLIIIKYFDKYINRSRYDTEVTARKSGPPEPGIFFP